eukprot:scaffold2033_cov164-Amphora_coffeaeformis.AAC.31
MRPTLTRLILLVMALPELCMSFAPNTRAPCSRGSCSTKGFLIRLNGKKYKDDAAFDEYFAEQIARDVRKNLDVPFMIPSPMVTYMVEQTVKRMSTDLSKDTKIKLQELVEAAATPSNNDDFVQDEINDLADRIAKEINTKIDVPVLDEEQEYILLQQILRVVLQSTTKTGRTKWVNTNLQISRELLGGPESRLQLAKSIDKKIEIPLPLEKAQRLALIGKAIDTSADLLTKLLPPEMLETLKGESPEGLLKMKEYLIDNVNAKVDLVGVNDEQERQLIETMINLLIDEYVDDTDAEFLLLTQQEQQIRLEEKLTSLEREKMFSQRRFQREQAKIDSKIVRIQVRLKEIRRNKSFLRRLLGMFRRKKK